MSELEIWNELGNIYYNAGAFDEAIRAYHRAIELDRGSGQSFSNLADIYLRKEFYTEAILMYQKGIELLKSPAEKAALWSRLGEVYLQLDRCEEATQAYQTAVNLDPENPARQEDLAKVIFNPTCPPLAADSSAAEKLLEAAPHAPEDPVAEAIRSFFEEPIKPAEMSVGGPAESDASLKEDASAAPEEEDTPAVTDVISAPFIPDSSEEMVEEEIDSIPPLPAEFCDQEPPEGVEALATEAQAPEHQREPEALRKAAAFPTDLPSADPESLEEENLEWIFQEEGTLTQIEADENDPIEMALATLGNPLVSDPVVSENGAAEQGEPSAPGAEEVPTAHSVPPFVQMDEVLPANIREQILDLQEELSENSDERLAFMPTGLEKEETEAPLKESEGSTTEIRSAEDSHDLNGLLAEALPADFEIPFERPIGERTLPAIEPQMEEPMSSRASALVKLGLARWRQSDHEGAIQFLETALNLAGLFSDQPFEALCYDALGMVETDLGNTDEAIHAFENAACLDAEHFHPWKDVGYLYSKSGRYEEALEAFKKAIEHTPRDSASWNGLGDVYHKLGRAEDAISAYQLGNVFDRHSRETSGFTPTPKPFEPGESNPRVLEEMGNLHFLNSAFDEAIHAYCNAIELLEDCGDQARLWRRLGDSYQRLNENDNARAAYHQASELQAGILHIIEPDSVNEASAARPVFEPVNEASREAAPAPQAENPSESDEAEGLFGEEPVPAMEVEAPERRHELETVGASEPEAAYWFLKASAPAKPTPEPSREASRPADGFRLSEDTKLGAVKPSPAFILPKYSSQVRLDKPLLAEAYEEVDVMVLEDMPETELEPPMESVDPSASVEAENSPLVQADHRGTEQEIDEMEGREFEANAVTAAGDQTTKADSHTLENDIAAYRRVTELNPLNDRAWDALGNMYEVTGLHSEAIAAFEKAISLASQREVYHYHLGLAHAAQKHYEKAIQSLQKVVALNPDYVLAHCALAGYYRRMGKDAEAREHMVVARPCMESENYYNQACFESICGNTDRAFAFLRNALDQKQVEVELALSDPDLDFIRQDPRFEELLTRKDGGSQVMP